MVKKDCVFTLGLRRIDRGRFFVDFFFEGGDRGQCVLYLGWGGFASLRVGDG